MTGGATGAALSCVVCGTEYPPGTHFCPLDGAIVRPLASAQDDLVGTVIDGRYHLVRKVGEGGMGDVYLGEHVRTQRRCAVKVVRSTRAADPEALGRFLREATNAGRISHPHVATVYDFGETSDGLAYLAMEFVEGEPLSAILQRTRVLDSDRAVNIARQVAEAVAAAHDLHIIHRDLKPANILISTDRKGRDHVKVVDFGIARVTVDEQQNLTRAGIVVGTPEFMSPEQLIGEDLDGRTDIYSLGCILYQMLTGEPAFGGATAQVITRRLTQKPPHPREKNPEISRALDTVVVTAMARKPEERYQTMDAVREALIASSSTPVSGLRRLMARLGTPPAKPAPAAEGTTASHTLGSMLRQITGSHTRQTGSRPRTQTGTTGAHATTSTPAAATPDTPEPSKPALPVAPSATGPQPALDPAVQPVPGDAATGNIPLATEPGVADASVDATTEQPRGRGPLFAAAAVIVLLIAAVLFFRSGEEPAPPPPEPPVAPAPVPTPPEHVLDDARAARALATEEDARNEFDAALQRLHSAQLAVTGVLVDFPDEPRFRALSDSIAEQMEATARLCGPFRAAQLRRNQPAPTCEIPD
jgi:serine/threonine protein kinase